jgi:hypothetical protein
MTLNNLVPWIPLYRVVIDACFVSAAWDFYGFLNGLLLPLWLGCECGFCFVLRSIPTNAVQVAVRASDIFPTTKHIQQSILQSLNLLGKLGYAGAEGINLIELFAVSKASTIAAVWHHAVG